MYKRHLLFAGGVSALSVALIALPGTSAKTQSPQDARIARLQQELEARQRGVRALFNRLMEG